MTQNTLFSLRLSLMVAGVATTVLVLVSLPLAVLVTRRAFVGKRVLEAAFTLPMVLPPTVLGYYLVVLFGRRGVVGQWIYQWTGWTPMFCWWGALIASMVVAFPLLFQSACSALASVDRSIEYKAYVLGATRWSTFWRVTLPLARNGLLSGVALAFARAMGEFGATMMLAGNIPGRTDTMPLSIYNAFSAGDYHTANMLAGFYAVLCLSMLWFVAHFKRDGHTTSV